jgi:hypothetical protein
MSLTQPPTRGWHYTYQGASMASNADKHEKKLVGLFLFVCLFVCCLWCWGGNRSKPSTMDLHPQPMHEKVTATLLVGM